MSIHALDPALRPSDHDLAIDAALDRAQAAWQATRDAEARARGEYVPGDGARIDATDAALLLARHGIPATLEPVRADGIYRVDPTGHDYDLEHAAEVLAADGYEVATQNGRLWARREPRHTNPPF